MPHNPVQIEKRNQHIQERFRYHIKKNPKWNIVAIIEEVADEVFLETSTVTKILKKKYPNLPTPKTIRKYASEFIYTED